MTTSQRVCELEADETMIDVE